MIIIDHLTNQPGTYVLALEISERLQIQVKQLRWNLNPGYYLYFGSAKGKNSTSLKNRIKRHFDLKKKVFWHIDHLTTHSSVILQCAYVNTSEQSTECRNLASFSKNFQIKIITRFGSSDCKEKCGGHLGFIQDKKIDFIWPNDYFKNWRWEKIRKEH
ncbi:MAG: GIY-YIG nuclease family protein [Candidatus Hodarchaeales archaeon]